MQFLADRVGQAQDLHRGLVEDHALQIALAVLFEETAGGHLDVVGAQEAFIGEHCPEDMLGHAGGPGHHIDIVAEGGIAHQVRRVADGHDVGIAEQLLLESLDLLAQVIGLFDDQHLFLVEAQLFVLHVSAAGG